MKRALATILALAFTPLAAQDFQKGFAAVEAGDYATALQEWKSLAGDVDTQLKTSTFSIGHGIPYEIRRKLPRANASIRK